MGSMIKEGLRSALRVIVCIGLVVTFLPAGQNAFGDAMNAADVSEETSVIGSNGIATTDVNVVYMDSSFRVVPKLASVNVGAHPSADDCVEAAATNGSAPYKTVEWYRKLVVNGTEQPTAEMLDDNKHADEVDGADADGITVFRHFFENDALSDSSIYNYYVRIVDADGNQASLEDSGSSPVQVIVKSNAYGVGTLTEGAWSVSDYIDSGDVSGMIQKGTSLEASQPYDGTGTAPGPGTPYGQLNANAIASDKIIAGVNADSNPAGTAVWHLILSEADSAIPVFTEDILVTLKAQDILGMLGLSEIPTNFSSDYTIMRTGGDGISIVQDSLVVGDDGTITFKLAGSSGSPAVNTNDLGYFALVRNIHEGDPGTFTVDPVVKDPSTGTVSPSAKTTYYAGTPHEYVFAPAGAGYFVKSVSLAYDASIELTNSDGAKVANPLVFDYTGTDKRTFCFDDSILGKPWETSVTMIVEFGYEQPDPTKEYNLTFNVGNHGSVLVDGNKVSDGAKLVKSGADLPVTITLVGDEGYPKGVLKRSSSGDAPEESWSLCPLNGDNSYVITTLDQDVWFSATFEEDIPDTPVYHTLTGIVTGALNGCSVYLRNDDGSSGALSENLSKKVLDKGSAVFQIRLANGYELAMAQEAFREEGGIEKSGRDFLKIDGAYNKRSGTLTVDNVTQDTIVYFAFAEAGSSDNPAGPVSPEDPNNPGIIQTPDIAAITVDGMRDTNDNVLSGWSTSLNDNRIEVPAGPGSRQAVSFFYRPNASDEWWVIDHLVVTYSNGVTRRIMIVDEASGGETNTAYIDASGNMNIVAVMRQPSASPINPPNIVAPGDLVVVESGSIVNRNEDGAPVKGVDSKGNAIGNGGLIDADGVWVQGGSVVPETVSAKAGSEQKVSIRPDNTNDDVFYYWTIDEVMVDGASLVPYVENNGSFEYDSTNHKYWFVENGIRTGESFSYSPHEGVITFDSLDRPHKVNASFERGVSVSVSAEGGAGTSSNSVWKAFKDGEHLRIVIAPEKDYLLDEFLVNGISRLNKMTAATASDINLLTAKDDVSARDQKLKSAFASRMVIEDFLLNAKASSNTLDTTKAQVYEFSDEDIPKSTADVANKTMNVVAKFKSINKGPDDGNTPVTPEKKTWTVHAQVGSGQGSIDSNGLKEVDINVSDGADCILTFIPAPGYQVVRVSDSGSAPITWTNNSFTVKNITSDRTVVVDFAMISTGGNRVINKVSAMLSTGDASLPLMFVALGVALGAAGVAVLIGKRKRRKD